MADLRERADQQLCHPVNPVGDDAAHEGPRGYAHVLKDGAVFAAFGARGDMNPTGPGPQGVYRGDTRHLSRLTLRVEGRRPVLLHAATRDDDSSHTTHLVVETGDVDQVGSVHVRRVACVADGAFRESLTLTSYAMQRVELRVRYEIDSDFADMFEVRGVTRARRGTRRAADQDGERIALRYDGLDGVRRRTDVCLWPGPLRFDGRELCRDVALEPGTATTLELAVICSDDQDGGGAEPPCERIVARLGARRASADALRCRITTDDPLYDRWLARSRTDLGLLLTPTEHGLYPAAGLPWFHAAFGRDGLVSALQWLQFEPWLAKDVLRTLAAWQATEVDPLRAAAPGRIVHEVHDGEMARLGEVPFGRYYGTCDATPLFVILAGRWFERTGDVAGIQELWPNIEAALGWIESESDADGFLVYAPDPAGLLHQGWKDSPGAVFHADGAAASGSIALCEVQAYAYDARLQGAALARVLGRTMLAERLARDARALRSNFDGAFWSEELGSYALALDGRRRPCLVRTSNAGHALFGGIARAARVPAMRSALFAPDLFSGWGIRTLATGSPRYNPAAYHNGSVWPHDTAMIAAGLGRYGDTEGAARLLGGLAAAAARLERQRLPETICGFAREPELGPTPYPSACAPQAWAAGAAAMALAAALGLRVDGARRRVVFDRPRLPAGLSEVRLTGLPVGGVRVDVVVRGGNGRIAIARGDRGAEVEIAMVTGS